MGTLALFDGKVDSFRGQRQLSHPSFTTLEQDATDLDVLQEATRLFAIYPASAKCSSEIVRKAVAVVLDQLDPAEVPDPLPSEVLEEHDFPGSAVALQLIHRPGSREQAGLARARFRYEEAFVLQTALARRRAQAEALPATPRPRSAGGLLAAFDARLPFELTAGQREVGEVVAADLAREHPMHRLLQGEVGSGKTVVALRAMLTVVDAGGQAALLAPTEVLAQQHHRSISAMLGGLAGSGMLPLDRPELLGADTDADGQTKVVLLTGSMPTAARRQAMLDAASGEAGIVVGTHALLQDKVDFFDLGLVVVDEQHRFGVEQRDALRAKAIRTPAPAGDDGHADPAHRGDDRLRRPRDVHAHRGARRAAGGHHPRRARGEAGLGRPRLRARREQVGLGRQAFVVCPRIGVGGSELLEEALAEIDDPDDDGRSGSRRPPRAVVDVVVELRRHPAMQGLRVEVLHGRMPPDDKDAVMAAVAAGEVDVLVATTVIEVGVDVPNAAVMIVMDADRFGISQLHQLRGRIGRGAHPGTCLLFCGDDARDRARERLQKVARDLRRLRAVAPRPGDPSGGRRPGRRAVRLPLVAAAAAGHPRRRDHRRRPRARHRAGRGRPRAGAAPRPGRAPADAARPRARGLPGARLNAATRHYPPGVTRIIAGRVGGRTLVVPRGRETRPTSDRVREALFSRLDREVHLDGAAVLDLYAGLGRARAGGGQPRRGPRRAGRLRPRGGRGLPAQRRGRSASATSRRCASRRWRPSCAATADAAVRPGAARPAVPAGRGRPRRRPGRAGRRRLAGPRRRGGRGAEHPRSGAPLAAAASCRFDARRHGETTLWFAETTRQAPDLR